MKPKRFSVSRRSFLKKSALAAATTGLPAWFVERLEAQTSAASPRSANDRPHVALIGCGGMGRANTQDAQKHGDIVAVCDVDETHAAEACKQFTKGGKTPDKYSDFRKLLEREDIHAIINATPDHWHTLINLAAAKAKKDIYGQKPLTLTIDEGKRLVQAVREHKNVFQTGSQQRSDRRFHLACELVRNGRLGKLKQVTVWIPAGRHDGPFSSSPVPAGLDWDFWLGQAPKVDYVKERCHSTFRYWYDYSGGTMTDWGAHHNDIALWALGLPGPVAIEGKPLAQPIPGGYTAFSEYEVQLTYANGVPQTVHSTTDDDVGGTPLHQQGQRHGIKFEGSAGWIWVNRHEIEASDESLLTQPLPASAEKLYVSADHMSNFFECMRSRKETICTAEIGHRSASACHLGNIALRLGQRLEWDPAREMFKGAHAKEANAMLSREMRKPYDYGFVR